MLFSFVGTAQLGSLAPHSSISRVRILTFAHFAHSKSFVLAVFCYRFRRPFLTFHPFKPQIFQRLTASFE